MDLFDYMREQQQDQESPLAARLRPETLEEVVGQQHIIGRGRMLYRAIRADKLGSIIFYGPPGTGKTTLARVIANTTSAEFTQLNATSSGKKDMEQGTVTLIGATTENPYFEVNSALISRSVIFELQPLSVEDIRTLIHRAVYDKKKGMGAYGAVIDEDAEEFLADLSGGDARRALNAVELAVLTTDPGPDGRIRITMDVARECIQKRAARYDKKGDNHYDTISAFIKSMRGSDPDAAVYYLARMLSAGEEPAFIARRIMICASEDVGNADPNALVVAVNCSLACERLGMPESQIVLAQAAEYVAAAPKSNTAVESIGRAMDTVARTGSLPIPPYLQDAHYGGASKMGRGIGYQYAHLYKDHYSGQQYLPDALKDSSFYEPSENGYEEQIRRRLGQLTGKEKYFREESLREREDG